jgi:tetratricopeptide (TPR) repeat protein
MDLPVITAWQIHTRDKQNMYTDEMAPATERLLRELRASIKGMRSLAISFDPNDNNVSSRLLRGEDEVVIEELEKRIALNPSDTSSLELLVSSLLSSGQYKEAKEKAIALTQLRNDDARAWLHLGLACQRLEDFSFAISAFKKVLEIDPLDLLATLGLAHCFEEVGDDEQSAMYFSRAQGLGGGLLNYGSGR